MALQLDLVGLPNAGKSTFLNALTRARAAVAPHLFTLIDSHSRCYGCARSTLGARAKLVHPQKVTPMAIYSFSICDVVR